MGEGGKSPGLVPFKDGGGGTPFFKDGGGIRAWVGGAKRVEKVKIFPFFPVKYILLFKISTVSLNFAKNIGISRKRIMLEVHVKGCQPNRTIYGATIDCLL